MNRRLFAAGVAAMAGTGSATAQEATPNGTSTVAVDTLHHLLLEVIPKGQYDAVTRIIDSDKLDANTVIEDLVFIRSYGTGEPEVIFISGDRNQAMAYSVIPDRDATTYDLFFYLAVDQNSGLIQEYSWMARINA